MFQRHYYCLIAGLKEIVLEDNKSVISQPEFKNELKEVLHPKDFELIELLFLSYDNQNLLNLLLKKKEEKFIERGRYSEEYLNEQIKDPEDIISYLRDFIIHFKDENSTNEKISWKNQLTEKYYNFLLSQRNEFVNQWFTFELNLKNIQTAINCRKHNQPVNNQLIGDNYIVDSIKKSTAKDFGLGHDFSYIEKLLQIYEDENLYQREREIALLKWEWLDENTFFHYFTIEKVFAYTVKLGMIDRWATFDKETGKEMFDKLIKDLVGSFEFPEEFNVVKTNS